MNNWGAIIGGLFLIFFLTESLCVCCTRYWFQRVKFTVSRWWFYALMAWYSLLSFSVVHPSLSLFLSLSAGCRLLPPLLQCLLFLGCLAHLLKAVASRPCCCHYVLTPDLTPRERPTGKKVCGTFRKRKGPRTKKTGRRREKGMGRSLVFQLLVAAHRECGGNVG